MDKDRRYSESVISRAREQMKSIIIHEEVEGSEEGSTSSKLAMAKESY